MNHQDLTINHRLESWVYANAAARTGASGFVAGDVSRISYQTDTGQYWRLTATTPTWVLIAPATPITYASLQTTPAAQVTTASTTFVMLGFGGAPANAKITPTATGKVFVTFNGHVGNANASALVTMGIRYGTGTAPATGAAAAGIGTTVGASVSSANSIANSGVPFCLTGLITGLAVGTQYWFDMVALVGAGTGQITGVAVNAVELP